MAKNETKPLKPSIIGEDEAAFNALQKITGYAPNNPNYQITALTQALELRRNKEAASDQAEALAATARDEMVSEQWAFHNLMLGAKDQVKAQFGKDSTQVQELGLKRASDYKSRKPKTKAAP